MRATVDSREIENLIRLLDAESPAVRERVRFELKEKAVDLGLYLRDNQPECSPDALYVLHETVRSNRHQKIRGSWLEWLDIDDEYRKLEAAFSYLSVVDDLDRPLPPLSLLLNQTLNRFLDTGGKPDVIALSRYLFRGDRLSGTDVDYYHPNHGNLCRVLMEGKGLPISLTAILMLCGSRLGLQIQGFNWPGHFMARAVIDGKPILIDCFNRGKILKSREIELLSMTMKVDIASLIRYPPTAVEIINRVLNNLLNAHSRAGNLDRHQLYNNLQTDLHKALR